MPAILQGMYELSKFKPSKATLATNPLLLLMELSVLVLRYR